MATGLPTRKTLTIGNGPVLPPKTRHFKFTMLAPIKYLSSDRTMTWSVRTLCSFIRSFTFRFQICDQTNIRWVAIENPQVSLEIWCYVPAIQRILIRLQIREREVEERVKLHNLRIHHVMIRWDLRYLIGAKVARTVRWNCSLGTTWPKNCSFMSGPGNNTARTKRVRFLTGSLEANRTELPVKTWTTGGLPGPIVNTIIENGDVATISNPQMIHTSYLHLAWLSSWIGWYEGHVMEICLIGEQIPKVDPLLKSGWQFVILDQVSFSEPVWSRKYNCNTKGVTMVMANSVESRCQSIWQIVSRVVVRELPSEWLLSKWLLSEWLLSERQLSGSQSGWSAGTGCD